MRADGTRSPTYCTILRGTAFGIYHPPMSNVQSSKSKVLHGFWYEFRNHPSRASAVRTRTFDFGPWTLDIGL